jgi:hypothetical protein
MKTTLAVLLVPVAALLSSSAFGQGIKTRVAAMKAAGKPEVISLEHDMFTCSSCDPEFKVKVSSVPQKVAGHAEFDAVVVIVRSPTSVELVEEHNHKNVRFYNYLVSADGKTLTVKYRDYSGPKEDIGGYTAMRVGEAPAGAHSVSGTWKIEDTRLAESAPAKAH